MPDSIQQLIRQAETQSLQVRLNLNFKKNLKIFKEVLPESAKILANHQPRNVILKLDPNGEVNLADTKTKTYFYNSPPKLYCKDQVENYQKNQILFRFSIEKNDEYNERHLHINHLNSLIDQYQEEEVKQDKSTVNMIPNIVVTGVGLGYHLPALLSELNIQNILIHEACIDTFHASLHTLDWAPIIDYFQGADKSIKFCIGSTIDEALQQVEASFQEIGFYSQVYTFIYHHTTRRNEIDFIQAYKTKIGAFIGGLGYYDDEQIGLAHAYQNIQTRHPTFISTKTHYRHTKLLLIGNGPSLDLHKNYIKRNRDKVILISCGTSLGSLLRMGIKPDFHIEMERTYKITHFLTYKISKQDLSGITLLCLHTVPPKVLSLFDKVCYAIKPNDAGTLLIHKHYAPTKLKDLPFCNPTVANCGLSFAVSMGFMNIHLIGIDLGINESGQHHSKNSLHYDLEKSIKSKNKFIYNYSDDRSVLVDGNLGNQVVSHPILNSSRIMMERLLGLVNISFPDFKCVNTNHGAKIQHTISANLNKLEECPTIDKKKVLSSIEADHFHYSHENPTKGIKEIGLLDYFYSIEAAVNLNINAIKSRLDLYLELTRVYRKVNRNNDPTTHLLLRGSLNLFFGAIMQHCLYCENERDFKKRIEIGVDRYNNFINEVYSRMRNEPFKIDDTQEPLFKELKI